MAKGKSGRLVIEIDPELKDELYTALNKEGLNLKQWFLLNTKRYLSNRSQMSLLLEENESTRKAS